MLDNLRNFGRSWIAKIFLGILIIAVAGFGIPSVFLDLNANTVARVGDQNISIRDFDRIYRAQINQFAQQTGVAPSGQEALAYGIPNAALARLANEASADILSQRLGLGVSDAKLADMVRRDPNFASALGLFDASEFSAMLRQSGFTEAEYLDLQRDIANREQVALVFDGVQLPQVALDIARSYENDLRTIDYVELNPVLFSVTDEPTEEQLAQFFAENQDRFRTVETRSVTLLPLTSEALAAGMEISDQDIAAEYERTGDQYVVGERRTIHQVTLPDADAAALFEAGLASGRSFASVVSEAGLQTSVSELGVFEQGELTDPTVADAAFALDEGGYSMINDDAGGQRVIWVSSVQEAGQQPIEAVRDDIAQSIASRRAQDMVLDVYDEIEEARAAFQPVSEVAERYGLESYDLDLTRDGAALADLDVLPPDSTQRIVEAVFAASEDAQFTPAINLGSSRTVFFELHEVQPERDQTLEEVRDEVVVAWQELETELNMTRTAEDLVAALDFGDDLFTLATAQGQTPQSSGTFGRSATATVLGPDVIQSAFQGGEGYANYVTTQDGNVVVFQVTDVIPAEAEGTSQVATALQTSFRNLLYSSFVEGLREDVGIRINEQAFNLVVGIE
ncbi:peptidylprolyl isomerase [Pelagibacterium luteolum]|uniref:Parvulin-like PPIase n=1 Tax=Pelagibacterium luteolum TaxID=440168 RepID=A0A1G7X0Q3_9HYPH|nr:peptidylprolyl isomerase [Pelagibacterium luteolum]SDG77736.1 peptidyl-prolyl cis-trans isomerase D [Pelagibacterium luteolum]